MENKQEFDNCIKDEELLSTICTALRMSAESKAKKDMESKYETEVIPGGDWVISDL